MHNVAKERRWSCGLEDGEDGGGGKRCGELLCYRAECNKDGGVGGEGCYAGERGEGKELRKVLLAFLEVLVGLRCGCGIAEGGCGEEEKGKGVDIHFGY